MSKARHFTPKDWQRRPGIWRGSLNGAQMGTDVTVVCCETDEVGAGPVLHLHPYAETFIVVEGRARYQIGETVIEAAAGDVLIGPGGVPHRFTNLGPGRLRTVDIHHSPEWIQTDLT
ncbi:MAG: cupin domain-containing protein [Paracoccus sp. (in: a-proteobacteria)]|nr:cupin domain-containing protein [Paracoccus sp. (in: a-proteobacteria)]